ncbi:hypothetical protein WKI71_06090 [Streptomyces sp. MS1.AVA.1]|uniref:acetyl-CoA C-acetyltransferase n=1 Tax=Streptomyces machairae TaxID=3134109 RepID=A0ABU8UH89_9ACTN
MAVVHGARTPIGRYKGALSSTPAHRLGALVIREAVVGGGLDLGAVSEVVLGCVGQVGPDAFNARRASLAAGLPVTTPAYNVNRLCGPDCRPSGRPRRASPSARRTSSWRAATSR